MFKNLFKSKYSKLKEELQNKSEAPSDFEVFFLTVTKKEALDGSWTEKERKKVKKDELITLVADALKKSIHSPDPVQNINITSTLNKEAYIEYYVDVGRLVGLQFPDDIFNFMEIAVPEEMAVIALKYLYNPQDNL